MNIKETLSKYISEAVNLPESEVLSMLEYPPDITMGDLAFPCFKLAKTLKKAPNVIAGEIKDKITKDMMDAVESCEAAGGYLNITLNDGFYAESIISAVLEQGDEYGSSKIGEGKTVVIDYSSPNIAKPLHIGHLRSTNIGSSIKKIHQFCGYKTVAINYLGDWGTPFGKVITAFKKWCNDMDEIEEKGVYKLIELYVRFGVEAEKDSSLNDEARAWFLKLEQGDEETVALWKKFSTISKEEFKRTYDMIGVEFDSYDGESFFEDKMPAVIDELKQKNLLKLDQGAQIVDLSEYDMPPCLIVKSDGATLYPTRDIASVIYRYNTYKFDKNIYITDMRQNLQFAQWIKVVELMGYEFFDRCVHVPFGLMSLDGEALGSRKGNILLLDTLFSAAVEKVEKIMEEKNPGLAEAEKKEIAKKVGIGAVMFSYLVNGRAKDVDFNWEDALNFNGNSGPYVQYTYARICGVLEKNEMQINPDKVNISNNFEREIIKLLSQFPEKVLTAEREYEPSVICRFLLEISAAFNRFYHECSILKAESEETKNSRLALCLAAKHAMGAGLWLIGLEKTSKV